MVVMHPSFVSAPDGSMLAVQLPVAEWRALVIDQWATGAISAGRAAELLAISLSSFLALADAHGHAVLRYAPEDLAAELSGA